MRHVRGLTLVMAALLAAGCPMVVSVTPNGKPDTAPSAKATAVSQVMGRVLVPANIIATDGASIIATDGASIVSSGKVKIIATDGASIIATDGASAVAKPRRVLQAKETRLAGARVYLSDAGRNKFPNVTEVKTDSQGRFLIPDVPTGHTFQLVVEFTTAEGKKGHLTSLVKSGQGEISLDVTGGSTLATTGVTEGLSGELGQFNQTTFNRAIRVIDQNPKSLPDWTNVSAIATEVQRLAAEVDELKRLVAELRQEVRKLRQDLTAQQKEIDAIWAAIGQPRSPSPSAGMPSPAPPASPSPAPSVAPSVAPSIDPATVPHAMPLADSQRFGLKDLAFEGDPALVTATEEAGAVSWTIRGFNDYWPVPQEHYNSPRLLKTMRGDFDMVARVHAAPPTTFTTHYHAAGLVMIGENVEGKRSALRFERARLEAAQVLNWSFFTGTTPQVGDHVAFADTVVDMRLTRTGDHFALAYKAPAATEWTALPAIDKVVSEDVQVGLIGVNNMDPTVQSSIRAKFEHVEISGRASTP